MAFVAADWTILRTSGANPNEIDYVGDAHAGASPSYATGIELHRALQDFADDQSDGTEEISIVDNVPSQRGGVDTNITLINGYHITPTAAEHLYDTSISQTHPVQGAQIYDGIQVFGNSTTIQIIQDGARLTNDYWNEPKMVTATSDATSNTSHRFILLVSDAVANSGDIDGRRLIGTQREYGTVYTEFAIGGGTNRGNNVLALTANSNLNNQTAQGTISALTFVIAEGYVAIDGDGNGAAENYYVEWDMNGNTKNEAYEYSQNMIREGVSVTPVNGTFGLDPNIFRGITHSVALSGGAGTWVEPESLSWGTGATAGTGQLLAVDNTAGASSTILYMQLLTGVVPNANTITGNGGATATAGTVTARVISVPPIGASTGTNIKGAYGVGIQEADLEAGDTLIDLTDTANNAPNNVTFSVIGLNITTTADYVLVGPDSAGSLDTAQMTLAVTLSGLTETQVNVGTGNIPVDTPSTGTIRIERDSGEFTRHAYTAVDGTRTFFTIASTDFSIDNATLTTNDVFISYIDKVATATTESFNTVFNATRALRVIVRNGATVASLAPIVPIDVAGSMGSGGGSTTLSRVLDT
jgi:hypothetical protein